MHILPKVKTQRQMAGQMTMSVSLAPTDREAPPISVGCAQSTELTEAEKIAQVGATKAACVDVAGITLTEGGRTR